MANFPEYKLRPVQELTPYANNARQHSPEQVDEIARSIEAFGFINPVVTWGDSIVAGHGRLMAAQQLGLASVPCIEADHLSAAQRKAYTLADNRLAQKSTWNNDLLAVELRDLQGEGIDVSLTGFDLDDFSLNVKDVETRGGLSDPDALPETADAVTREGDVWQLGLHRVMCGDSTDPAQVATLAGGEQAALLHADPPYGMGKAAEGVANDNLYREKLDAFQLDWWRAFRPQLIDRASAYIWGNAPDLWRLWYSAGLGASERLELRNEIVWDKGSATGMRSGLMHQYPVASERCLYFQFGQQFVGNVNTEDFPESWGPTLEAMQSMARAADLKPADVRRVCGVAMYSHWFTRSQFNLIPEKHYDALAAEYPEAFNRRWLDLRREWVKVKQKGRDWIKGQHDSLRSYFDNAHDTMNDVWKFDRVTGSERYEHATPKPVAMMERVMRSSLPAGGLCLEPFGGTGATLMGAHRTGRRCYTMELQPRYCDVIVKRWQDFTGEEAVNLTQDRTYGELANA